MARTKTQSAQSRRDFAPSLPEKDAPDSGKWYGAQTLALDATALAMLAIGIERQAEFLAGAGAAGYLLAAPIVHGAHRKGGRAWGSLGLRVALPSVGAIVAGDDALIGSFVGAVGASVIDSLRAYDDPKHARTASGATLHLLPVVGRRSSGVSFGGSF